MQELVSEPCGRDGKFQMSVTELKRINDAGLLKSIIEAVEKYDIASSPDWDALGQLSNRTEFEALEASPDGIFEGPSESFQVVGDVYVTLNYGGKDDGSSMSDSYPVQLTGKFDRKTKRASIDHVSIDTSSFYK